MYRERCKTLYKGKGLNCRLLERLLIFNRLLLESQIINKWHLKFHFRMALIVKFGTSEFFIWIFLNMEGVVQWHIVIVNYDCLRVQLGWERLKNVFMVLLFRNNRKCRPYTRNELILVILIGIVNVCSQAVVWDTNMAVVTSIQSAFCSSFVGTSIIPDSHSCLPREALLLTRSYCFKG